jgi:hypothetical protein
LWLVFAHAGGLCDAVIERLNSSGGAVVSVHIGERFAALGPTPTRSIRLAADYEALLDALVESGRFPKRIAHMWSLGSAVKDAFARAGSWFLQHPVLAQASARGPPRRPRSDDHRRRAARGWDLDVVAPEKSTVLGLSLVIPQEHPYISCATVDVERVPANGATALADLLHAELRAERAGASIAYRGTQRFVQTVEPAPLATPSTAGEPGVLRQQGVYLITGGLGNIGLAIAGRLARDVQARLVLVGRSTPPARDAWQAWLDTHAADDRRPDRSAVRELEALGADVRSSPPTCRTRTKCGWRLRRRRTGSVSCTA